MDYFSNNLMLMVFMYDCYNDADDDDNTDYGDDSDSYCDNDDDDDEDYDDDDDYSRFPTRILFVKTTGDGAHIRITASVILGTRGSPVAQVTSF